MLSLVDSFLLVPGMELRYWIPFLGITIILRLHVGFSPHFAYSLVPRCYLLNSVRLLLISNLNKAKPMLVCSSNYFPLVCYSRLIHRIQWFASICQINKRESLLYLREDVKLSISIRKSRQKNCSFSTRKNVAAHQETQFFYPWNCSFSVI